MPDAPRRRHGVEAFLATAPAGEFVRVEVRVRSASGFVNLRLAAGRSGDDVARLLGQGLPMDANTFTGDGRRIYWLGPEEWLIATEAGDAANVCARLESLAQESHVAVNDLSGGYVALRLSGDDARTVLAKGCTLDLHPRVFAPGQCAQSGLAKANVLLAAVDDAPSFELIVRRSFADYVCRWLAYSARAHGVRFLS